MVMNKVYFFFLTDYKLQGPYVSSVKRIEYRWSCYQSKYEVQFDNSDYFVNQIERNISNIITRIDHKPGLCYFFHDYGIGANRQCRQ